MSVKNIIESKLIDRIDLLHLQVINECANHNVPPGSESHFKVVLVSDEFYDKTLLDRHRLINSLLADERDMLEDLVAAAFNDAVHKLEQTIKDKFSGMTTGMGLPPGIKLPF